MQEVRDLGMSYDTIYATFEKAINDGARQWSARLLEMYPNRAELEQFADMARARLSANAVEVNAIGEQNQTTVAKSPSSERASVPLRSSLCVLTVGAGVPLSVENIPDDITIAGHPAGKLGIKSWASVPILIQGSEAGTVCALDLEQPRSWTDADQAALQHAADEIAAKVDHWFQDSDKSIFL